MQDQNAQRLRELTDETLAELIGTNADAFAELFARYRGIVRFFAGRYAVNASDSEDYMQEGMLGLYSAAVSYSKGRQVRFRTFASACIRNRIRNAARAERKAIVSEMSFDDPESALSDTVSASDLSPEQEYLAQERADELDSLMNRTLSRQEREIFCLAISGLTYEEIATYMHSPRKSVDNAIQRARRKLREAIGSVGFVKNAAEDHSADKCAEDFRTDSKHPQQSG